MGTYPFWVFFNLFEADVVEIFEAQTAEVLVTGDIKLLFVGLTPLLVLDKFF